MSVVREPVLHLPDVRLADKWGHLAAYLLLAALLMCDSARAGIVRSGRWTLSLVLPILYGGVLEIVQMYCPPRSADWLDWLADMIGTLIGAALGYVIWHIMQASRN